ncbi:aspartate kinase [Ferrimonas aestuarii]|uniref:Aspartokinase n=1 Tax=Ferrimonas aestuarii TaxID=2569539 RepID=A0A4U1BUN3_9GAMM|nr:aspartate kinase [Ferrimonas aestuarii]TKB58291.1 aspartate kinase [Ferrimonas aestuarii]
MALLVQKYGGTSVGSFERIEAVADQIVRTVNLGHQVVVVLSAMAGETNRLLGLASKVSAKPSARELDVLVSSGEQISVALMALALQKRGIQGISLLGSQVSIHTDDHHGRAEITEVQCQRIERCLTLGQVPIIAGFQGINGAGDITTLGRGGSDTTAVAVAASIRADECQIFTDVEGVYTTDPRVEPHARKMDCITFEEMLELSSLGAKVLQIRSVEFAGKHRVPLRVLSSFQAGEGTLIRYDNQGQSEGITGIAFNRNEVAITLSGLEETTTTVAEVFAPLNEAKIPVDMLVQSAAVNDRVELTFTLPQSDLAVAKSLLDPVVERFSGQPLVAKENMCKVSVVGAGLPQHSELTQQVLEVLAEEGIHVHLLASAEIKLSVAIEEKYLELAVRSLHSAFKLSENV